MTRRLVVRGAFGRACSGAAGVVALVAVGLLASPAGAEEAFRCELKEAAGLSEPDGRTAARVLCEQLRRASGGRGAFAVRLAPLGRIVVVTVAQEGSANSVSVQVEGLEEIPVAAGRIAEALVHSGTLDGTQRVDNLLSSETRPLPTKSGSFTFTVGVADVESAGHGARAAGLSLGLVYASPRLALPAEMRFAWDEAPSGEPRLDLFSVSVGGRHYFSKRDWSPFVGGGLGILRLHAAEGGYPEPGSAATGFFDAERFGLAPYAEAGVETLRLHRARVLLHVRADFPTGALQSPQVEVYSSWDERTGRPVGRTVYPGQSRYVVPVTISLTVAF